MPTLNLDLLKAHRARTFNLPPHPKLTSPSQALDLVNARGFIYFWPIKGIDFPSLWTAVAGDRPVPNEHDDPGHVTWGWKDNALDQRIWYYAKVLRRKANIISLEVAPYFYALTENYGDYREDYLIPYEDGRLPQGAKQVYEAILDNGPLHTIDLRRLARMSNARDAEFNKALEILQADFKILPIGVAQAGSWNYAFIYEIAARYYPDLPEKARHIGEAEARMKLLELYFQSVGAAQMREVNKLFRWGNAITERAVRRLLEKGNMVVEGVTRDDKAGEWLALVELVT
ncbi:MAG: winged helix DNA-binding domain-containing protein [Anaerolineales bacterium]|nr:winged helix DNA-binding domain-containing protein [Anaerolineales bacterium]